MASMSTLLAFGRTLALPPRSSLRILRPNSPLGPFKSSRTLTTHAEPSIAVQPLNASFPFRWLRDACQCPQCVHPSTQQRLHRTSDLAAPPLASGVARDGVHVKWDAQHESFFPLEWLRRYVDAGAMREYRGEVRRRTWDAKGLRDCEGLFVPYEALDAPGGLLAAIEQLAQYGLLFVRGVPTAETDNKTCELRALARRFGELRETLYGETWDVRSVKDSKNIAYTNLNLDLHMDLLYFEHPPRYQILHCLLNRVHGGASIFVDALRAAQHLLTTHPDAFAHLASTPVPFHYVNDGHHLHRAHPTIELSPPGSGSDEIAYVNYSPPFQAPLPLSTPRAFYGALAEFAALLDAPEYRYEYTLREGDAVVFDNRRVLHARTAFSEVEGAEAGIGGTNRWLKGCYLEADAIMDRWRVLRKGGKA